jgi:hypothetical protein
MTTQGTESEPRTGIEVWIGVPAEPVVEPRPTGFDESKEVEKQALWRKKAEQTVAKVDPEEFLNSWNKTFAAVEAVFAADRAPKRASGFELESVTAKLALKASGKVVFIAEVGAEVAFEATFTRRKPPDALGLTTSG